MLFRMKDSDQHAFLTSWHSAAGLCITTVIQ